MFRRALLCTDFTDGIDRLTQFAHSLARSGLQQLVFFHNVAVEAEREIPRPEPELLDQARQQLVDALQDLPSGLEVLVDVQMGRPSSNIVRLAEHHGSDVIFLGTPTRTMLEEKLFGSTTIRLTERTKTPLIILRPQLISTYTTRELSLRCESLFSYLLIPYDGSRGADYLIQCIKTQVRDNPHSTLERCRLLWVIDDSVRPELLGDDPMKTAEERLGQVQGELADLGLVANASVVEGDPLEEIMQAAQRYDISALATCSRGMGGFMKWSAPSLTREILRASWHPVLFFPPGS